MVLKQFFPIVLLLTVLLPAPAARALDDPPSLVARIAAIEGGVSIRRAAAASWDFGLVNMPAVSNDSFWTEPGARAVVQAGPLTISMDSATELDITRLDDSGLTFAVPQGTVSVIFRASPGAAVTVLTPQGRVTLERPGDYHIETGAGNAGDPGTVAVVGGQASLDGPVAHAQLPDGRAATWGGQPPIFSTGEIFATAFDDWARQNAGGARPSVTLAYLPSGMTGYQDLDRYGAWARDNQYGALWYPSSLPGGWVPYRNGSWRLVAPWGWTWIDARPWGFAPFHYGRWVRKGGRWAWWPGHGKTRAVYAPALVSFIGFDDGQTRVTVTEGLPAIGWVPLAPYEIYRPWYNKNPDYWRRVNRRDLHPELMDKAEGKTTLVNIGDMTATRADLFQDGQRIDDRNRLTPRGPGRVLNDIDRLPEKRSDRPARGPWQSSSRPAAAPVAVNPAIAASPTPIVPLPATAPAPAAAPAPRVWHRGDGPIVLPNQPRRVTSRPVNRFAPENAQQIVPDDGVPSGPVQSGFHTER